MSAIDIAKWAARTGANLDEAVIAIKTELFSSIINDTRVDTGRLRGNWQTTTGEPNMTTTNRESKENDDAPIQEVEKNVTPGGVDYMTNNLPYAEYWEERDAMVAKNFARVGQIVSGAIK